MNNEAGRYCTISKRFEIGRFLALNGKAGVSEETRLHILQIVEENNYVPLRNTNKK